MEIPIESEREMSEVILTKIAPQQHVFNEVFYHPWSAGTVYKEDLNFVTTMPADVLAPNGARPSAVTVLVTKSDKIYSKCLCCRSLPVHFCWSHVSQTLAAYIVECWQYLYLTQWGWGKIGKRFADETFIQISGDKPLSESMMIYVIDAYVRHSASMSQHILPSHILQGVKRLQLFTMKID